jgi:glutathione S-transferase
VIELWHEWNSVHSFKVRVVLAEKRLDWTDRRIELLKFEHLRPEYLKLNPNGLVPTLVDGGRVILESTVICQYLDEAFPEPALLPADPYGRARARVWLKYFDDFVHPAVRAASFRLLYRPLLAALPRAELMSRLAAHPDPARARAFLDAPTDSLDRAEGAFKAAIARIESALEGEWLVGSQFGLADIAMAPFVERLAHLRMDKLWKPFPRARVWSAAVLARVSVLAAQAPDQYRFPLAD